MILRCQIFQTLPLLFKVDWSIYIFRVTRMVTAEEKQNFRLPSLIWHLAEFCDKIKNTELFISQSFLPSFSLMKTSYKLFKKLLSFLQTVLLYVGKLHSWSVDENLYKFFSPHCRVKFASYHLFGSANRASAFASSLSSFILWLCRCVCGGNLLRSAWACW